MPIPAPRLKREQIPAGACLCEYCPGKCCRYFALPIDTPENWKDFDYLRWYMLHGPVSIFIEKDTWYLMVHTVCRHLQSDNRCGIYETRPEICRDYTTADCEYDDDWVYDRYFETPEQIEEYAEAILPPRTGKSFRSARPPRFPVLPVL